MAYSKLAARAQIAAAEYTYPPVFRHMFLAAFVMPMYQRMPHPPRWAQRLQLFSGPELCYAHQARASRARAKIEDSAWLPPVASCACVQLALQAVTAAKILTTARYSRAPTGARARIWSTASNVHVYLGGVAVPVTSHPALHP
jgi:hypothetical protein